MPECILRGLPRGWSALNKFLLNRMEEHEANSLSFFEVIRVKHLAPCLHCKSAATTREGCARVQATASSAPRKAATHFYYDLYSILSVLALPLVPMKR